LRAFLVFRQDGIGDVAKHTILAEFKRVVGTVDSAVNAPPSLVQLCTHVGTDIGLHNVLVQVFRGIYHQGIITEKNTLERPQIRFSYKGKVKGFKSFYRVEEQGGQYKKYKP